GETYDEQVRVVQIGGPWSRELCGGTHVSRSSQIGLVSLIGETSVGSGSRRLEALVGIEAFRSLAAERALVARLTDALKAPKENLEEKLAATIEELKLAQRKLSALQAGALAERIPAMISAAEQIGSVSYICADLGHLESVEDLRTLATKIRDQASGSAAAIALFAEIADKPMLVVATTEPARAAGFKAGALVRIASAVLGGGGGGKDDMAQGGGTDLTQITAAVQAIRGALSA
ncbi:DHHA1 domain-containing protein, partial [Rhodoluna sp.]|uniref:DHHA1 domain-containing protein n=1 Tax=Rhodoluna sp. TaxID=1969481 RepID=UPI0025CC38AA